MRWIVRMLNHTWDWAGYCTRISSEWFQSSRGVNRSINRTNRTLCGTLYKTYTSCSYTDRNGYRMFAVLWCKVSHCGQTNSYEENPTECGSTMCMYSPFAVFVSGQTLERSHRCVSMCNTLSGLLRKFGVLCGSPIGWYRHLSRIRFPSHSLWSPGVCVYRWE